MLKSVLRQEDTLLKTVKWAWRLMFVGLLVLSITLNVAMFIGGMLYNVASSAFHSLTGMRTVAMQHADEVTDLTTDVAQERAAKRKLRRELTDVTDDLVLERATSRKLRLELSDASFGMVTYRGQKVAVREALDHTAKRVSKRAAVTSAREIGSMAGEALPYAGIAVIVGATALELKDLCDTLKDMSELQRALDPDIIVSDEEKTVCAQRVPTREELWAAVKSSPGKAWDKAKGAVPTLEEIKDYELPDIDWEGTWSSAVGGASKGWEATKSGSATAFEAAKHGVNVVVDGTIDFWADDKEKAE